MGEQHTAAAVALQSKLLQRLAFIVLSFLHKVEETLPLVPDHLAAREAAHGDNHLGQGACDDCGLVEQKRPSPACCGDFDYRRNAKHMY